MNVRRSEARRLESLWAGGFGDAYVARNALIDPRRSVFWGELLAKHAIRSVLEVGCGQGANLGPIAKILLPQEVWGVDVNDAALARARLNAPGTNLATSAARRLPYRDGYVDLVFTMGVLIHQPDDTLSLVMAELVRCTRRYVLWGEYYAPATEEVPYRGEQGALFKRDYGSIFAALFPELTVVEEGFLQPEDGFDRVTWQLLSLREA
ncbi:MAG: pseudaminic acid biosynthesis-associated methylase [Candidatus Limnocylindrales bacterium]